MLKLVEAQAIILGSHLSNEQSNATIFYPCFFIIRFDLFENYQTGLKIASSVGFVILAT